MYYICDKTYVLSILENLYVKKYIKQNGKMYEFHIENNTLLLSVYTDNSPPLLTETYTLETNVKGEFSVCEDEQGIIHVVAANKKYDLIYIRFDGEKLKKETVYMFNNNFIIPTTPVIQARNNIIVIVSEFLSAGSPKEWSLRAYTQKNRGWDYTIIDKGAGLCYTQPDIKIDEQMNLHLIYRELKEHSCLKYVCADAQKARYGRAKVLFDSGTDQYSPLVFINRFNEVFAAWIEIDGDDANLCCTNINTESSKEIFKVDISQNIADVRIYSSGWHIYCIFQSEEGYYYDLCCRKKVIKQWNPKIIPKKGGVAMSSDFRQFLDIKRELEYKISELKNHAGTDHYEKTVTELQKQNLKLTEQIISKEQTVEDTQNEISLLRSENDLYKKQIAKLQEQLQANISEKKEDQEEIEMKEKKSVWSSIRNFFSD